MAKKITIIIPTWNGKEFLKICFRGLDKQTNKNFKVIVVDNGSSDGTREFVKENYPAVNFIAFDKNLGFAAAVNAGIQSADSDYVFLLNNDIELNENCFDVIQKAVDSGIADVFMCKFMDFEQRKKILDIGNTYSIYGHVIQEGRGQIDGAEPGSNREIFSACAGAAIYQRELFEKIGYFDEDFFAYLEDVDLGFRLQLAGYKTMLLPSALVYHIEGATSSQFLDFREYYSLRNNLYLIFKNFPLALLFLLFPFIFLYQLRNLLVFIKQKKLSIFCKAYICFFKNLNKVIQKRRFIQKTKKQASYSLFKKLSKKIPFKIANYFRKTK